MDSIASSGGQLLCAGIANGESRSGVCEVVSHAALAPSGKSLGD